MSEKINIKIIPGGSFANWQISSRDTNTVVAAGDMAGSDVSVQIDSAPNAGYFFQVNGHTAYLLDHDPEAGFSYRTPSYVDVDSPEWDEPTGLSFGAPQSDLSSPGSVKYSPIKFNTKTVVLKIPKRAHTSGRVGTQDEDIFHGIERDDLQKYLKRKTEKAHIYRLKVVEDGRFFLTSAMTLTNKKVLLGGGHFKFLSDGNLRRYIPVRASAFTGTGLQVEVLDTYYVKRTDPTNEGSKPRIVANPGYWVDDDGDQDD